MDLPPSGWYPDPYGTPSLLRWWDGSGWTQHTHPDVSTGGAGGEPTATAVQSAAAQSAAVQATTVQQATVQPTTVQPTTVQPATGQPSPEWLSRTKPPTGPPTAPQPALPAYPGAPAGATPGIAPTAYQPPVAAAQPGGMQPTVIQPGYPQPGSLPPVAGPAGGDGTQVLFLGDAWQPPGGPGMPPQGNPYGYAQAQRRRRRRVVIGLTAGTVVAVAAIAIIATTLSSSPSTQVADQSPAALPSTTSASPTPTASATASATPTATATGSLLTDGQAGLSYSQLTSPWQGASCPTSLNNGAFTWTAGEYAPAGPINGGSATWYGEACSGLLPTQYAYTGTSDLQNTTENLAQTFGNAYYGALDHSINVEEDQQLQVSGHSAWEVTYDVSYTNAASQGATWSDEQAAVVVVDNGTGQPAVFFTSIPQNLNENNVSTLVSSLQLASSNGAAATPSASTQDDGNGNGNGNNP